MLLLDSAFTDDARSAADLGFVRGATTNPTLMARTGRAAEDVILEFTELLPGPIFHQLTGATVVEREAEARRFAALRPGRVGLKVPCTTENLALVARLTRDGLTCGMTTIFSPAQAFLAAEAGATYLFPYVNRTTRLFGDGVGLVREMRAVIDALGASVAIVAASVKSADEAVASIVAGAHGLTLPIPVLASLGEHPGSVAAIEEFAAAGR